MRAREWLEAPDRSAVGRWRDDGCVDDPITDLARRSLAAWVQNVVDGNRALLRALRDAQLSARIQLCIRQ